MRMTDLSLARVEGPRLRLRLVEPEDAAFIYGLRSDPTYNQYLSEVSGGVEAQRRWIEAYKTREAAGEELYYVIERLDGTRCGVVRLYDIGAESFTWGSWILDHNKPAKAALESAFLIYVIAFDRLGLLRAEFDVRLANERTIAFHLRFGATETRRDNLNAYFVYPKEQFLADRDRYLRTLASGLS